MSPPEKNTISLVVVVAAAAALLPFKRKMVRRKYHPSIIRHPPSPPHRHHRHLLTAANKEKEEECTGMVGAKYNHLSRCKRKRIMNNQSLPDDMFEILAHLCAKDIYDVARLVSRKWYNMIYNHSFIHAHLQHAPHGLLFHSNSVDLLYVTMRQGRVEISKLIKFTMQSWCSCNGLILESHLSGTFYVVNPMTNQIFVLPTFTLPLSTGRRFMMAYAAAYMEYKVVVASVPIRREGETFMHCYILTFGVDKSWKTIRGPYLTRTDLGAIKLFRPIMTQGFIHWGGDSDILTFNVETEIITRNRRPKTLLRRPISQRRLYSGDYGYPVTYLSTGGQLLSSLVVCGELLWEVWEMKPDSGEWRKLFDIDLEDDKWRLEQLRPNESSYGYLMPLGWVKYPEVLVFRLGEITKSVLIYNLDGTFHILELHSSGLPYRVFHHQNSLLWLAGS